MLKYCLVVLLGFYANTLFAQSRWQSKGMLYHDKSIAVRIEYKLNKGSSACRVNSRASQFRYRIMRHKGKRSFYLNWHLDYMSCAKEHIALFSSLHINKATKIGILVPYRHKFKASRPINFFTGVNTSRYKSLFGFRKYNHFNASGALKANRQAYIHQQGKNAITTALNGYNTTISSTDDSTHIVTSKRNAIAQADSFIVGRSEICQGEMLIKLTVAGKALSPDSRWTWYKDNDTASFNVGYTITVSPKFNTTYYVRAESPSNKGAYHSHTITVMVQSATPQAIAGPDFVPYKQKITLSLNGGMLGNGAKWVWYTGTINSKKRISEGATLTIDSATATQTYYVRGENACQNTDFVTKTVKVTGSPIAKLYKPTAFFVNVGAVIGYLNYLGLNSNYIVTVGRGGNVGWYVRGKFSVKPTSESFQTDLTTITNYNVPGYYQYTGRTINQHNALTGGFYFGSKYLSIYAGGGYGDRKLLRQINQYGYNNVGGVESSWVKDTSLSSKGIEGEGGLLVDIGHFNIMSGLSSIEFKYIEYNLGVGYRF